MSKQDQMKKARSRQKNSEKATQRKEKESLYSTLFPPYQPSLPYSIHFINKTTAESNLIEYKSIIEKHKFFICDVEGDKISNEGALLQVMLVEAEENQPSTTIFLFEMKQLPPSSTLKFTIVQQILNHLFTSSVVIYTWGFLQKEIDFFVNNEAIPRVTNVKEINLQAIFRLWFNQTLQIIPTPLAQFNSTISSQLLSHERMNRIKIFNNQDWSLQDSIVYILHQHLSKEETRQQWSLGLDEKLSNNNYSMKNRNELIRYAVFDCLSVYDIMLFIHKICVADQQRKQQQIQSIHDYLLDLHQRIIPPKKVKNVVQMLIEELSDEEGTGHDRDDRHILSNSSTINNRTTNTTYETTATIMLIDDEIILNVPHQSNQQIIDQQEQQQVIHQQLDQQSILIESPPEQSTATTSATTKRKRKRTTKRSSEAKARRNKKSSIRHRAARYKHEVIRPLNMSVTDAKKKLKEMNVHPDNINPVGQYLYLSVNDQQRQQDYEQRLPMNIFL